MSHEERTLYIDGDVIAYIAALSAQEEEEVHEDGYGYVRPFANYEVGCARVDQKILRLMDGLGATHCRIFLSDPDANWRNEIAPSYKANRFGSARPILLGRLKAYLRIQYGAEHWAGLEADDVLGIMATSPRDFDGDAVVCGRDKDFRSIPGKHHYIETARYDSGEALKVTEVSLPEANEFHMVQTLAGDRVDGYDGCPGLGMERAARVIRSRECLVPKKGIITRGPRKGQETTKWYTEPCLDMWEIVVSHYRKAGLGPKEALLNARLAHILRYGDYDRDTDRLMLWSPEQLIVRDPV